MRALQAPREAHAGGGPGRPHPPRRAARASSHRRRDPCGGFGPPEALEEAGNEERPGFPGALPSVGGGGGPCRGPPRGLRRAVADPVDRVVRRKVQRPVGAHLESHRPPPHAPALPPSRREVFHGAARPAALERHAHDLVARRHRAVPRADGDRKSTRLNSSHGYISYAVFCLKKKKEKKKLQASEKIDE